MIIQLVCESMLDMKNVTWDECMGKEVQILRKGFHESQKAKDSIFLTNAVRPLLKGHKQKWDEETSTILKCTLRAMECFQRLFWWFGNTAQVKPNLVQYVGCARWLPKRIVKALCIQQDTIRWYYMSWNTGNTAVLISISKSICRIHFKVANTNLR